jgi:hypothetical protein
MDGIPIGRTQKEKQLILKKFRSRQLRLLLFFIFALLI